MSQAPELTKLAEPLFGPLSGAEKLVIESATTGEIAQCFGGLEPDDASNDPAYSDAWDKERRVRAKFLRWLCADESARRFIDPRGIRIESAWIDGELSLSFLKVPFQLGLLHCRIKGDCRFNLTEIPRIDFTGSWIESVNAEHLVVKGDILLKSVVCIDHEVRLHGARIGGRLNCDGARFENPARADKPSSGSALIGEAIHVEGSVLLRQPFSAQGLVRLFNAHIDGNLECDGAQLENPAVPGVASSGTALDIEGAVIGASVYLRGNKKTGGRDFSAKGQVWLYRTQIGGNLVCDGGSFENPAQKGMESTGTALNASTTRIGGSAFFRSGFYGRGKFSAVGSVWLVGAQIGRTLECDGAQITNPAQAGLDKSGIALQAAAMEAGAGVWLRKGFHARGTVTLYGARIGADLDCDGGIFENAPQKDVSGSGYALALEGVKVGGSVLCRSGFYGKGNFSASGVVRMYRAQIEGNLECDGGKFQNPAKAGVTDAGVALTLEASRVSGGVFLRSRFFADGLVRLFRAQIGGSLDCSRGKFKNPGIGDRAGKGTALNAIHLKTTGDVLLSGVGFEVEGEVSLSKAEIGGRLQINGGKIDSLDLGDASAGAIVDDVDNVNWQARGKVNLDGFTYGRIVKEQSNDPLDQAIEEAMPAGEISNVAHRLEWLELQPKFTRQPYLQFAKMLKEEGDSKGSRKVGISMEKRARSGQNWWRRLGGHVLRWTIGYGYTSERALYWLVCLIFLGTAVYWHGWGSMVPTQADVLRSIHDGKDVPENYGHFHAFAYSIDNSFPLVKLGMGEKWTPREPAEKGKQLANGWVDQADSFIASADFLRCFRWGQVAVGWILTTLFAVGLTGIIRKD
jgi:hypothetical protein